MTVPGSAPQPDADAAPPAEEAAFAPIAQECGRLGLTPCGVVAAHRDRGAEARYRRWLAAGRHGSMAYLERHAPFKADPAALLPGCRSVLMVALGYYQTPERGWIKPAEALRRSAAVCHTSAQGRTPAAGRIPARATSAADGAPGGRGRTGRRGGRRTRRGPGGSVRLGP